MDLISFWTRPVYIFWIGIDPLENTILCVRSRAIHKGEPIILHYWTFTWPDRAGVSWALSLVLATDLAKHPPFHLAI